LSKFENNAYNFSTLLISSVLTFIGALAVNDYLLFRFLGLSFIEDYAINDGFFISV
jgi:hypothetical protein